MTKRTTARGEIRKILSRNGFIVISAGRGSIELAGDDNTHTVQLLDGAAGAWAIMDYRYREVSSGIGAASFKRAFTQHVAASGS